MSSRPDRRAFLLLAGAALALGGCGFRPLYGSSAEAGPVEEELALIHVGVIPDRPGQILRAQLIQRLNPAGRPEAPRYDLTVSLTRQQQSLNILTDDSATRANLLLGATYRLSERESGATLVENRVGVTTSFNILDDQFATLTAERDALNRGLRQLSQSIRTELALYFARR